MSDRKDWQLYFFPVGDVPVDDSALLGLEFVPEHETLEAAWVEGLRVLRELRESGDGNVWRAVCYQRNAVGNRTVQITGARNIKLEADD